MRITTLVFLMASMSAFAESRGRFEARFHQVMAISVVQEQRQLWQKLSGHGYIREGDGGYVNNQIELLLPNDARNQMCVDLGRSVFTTRAVVSRTTSDIKQSMSGALCFQTEKLLFGINEMLRFGFGRKIPMPTDFCGVPSHAPIQIGFQWAGEAVRVLPISNPDGIDKLYAQPTSDPQTFGTCMVMNLDAPGTPQRPSK